MTVPSNLHSGFPQLYSSHSENNPTSHGFLFKNKLPQKNSKLYRYSSTKNMPASKQNEPNNTITSPTNTPNRAEALPDYETRITTILNDVYSTREWKQFQTMKRKLRKLRKTASLERTRNKKALTQLYELKEQNVKLENELKSISPFEKVLSHTESLDDFHAFCRKEHNHENVEFWVEASRFRNISSGAARLQTAEYIYNKYIAQDSDFNLNISEDQRNYVERQLAEAETTKMVDKRLFDSILNNVYQMMYEDSFQRFTMSASGRNLLALLNNNDKNSLKKELS